MSWSRVSAIVCNRCGDDLVYVELTRGPFDGRLHQDHWVTPWFGCSCPDRQRLLSAETFAIVENGGGHDAHVERWGPASR